MSRVQLRIFLGSPSADTQAARERVAAVVREVCADAVYARMAELTLCRWDDPDRPVICAANGNPQLDVVEQAGHPAQCDLFIGLLSHTMGGLLPDRFGQSPAGRPWFCTEWEIHQALDSQEPRKLPTVWIWREATGLVLARELPASEKRALAEQSAQVDEYVASFKSAVGTIERGLNHFTDLADLDKQLRHGLRAWVARVVGPTPPDPAPPTETLTTAQQTLLDVLLGNDPEAVPAPAQIQAVLAEPVSGLRGHLLRRYAQWATLTGGRLDRRFVNLTLMLDRGLEFDGARFAPDDRQRAQGRYDDLAELLDDHADVGAWVLVGDPGSGKSTILQHHELVTARSALQALSASPHSAPPEVCVWQRLSEYTAGGPPPAQWLAERWTARRLQHPGLPALAELQGRVRLRYLLDGLNEIKAPTREAQLQAVGQWTAWAEAVAGQGPAPLFSVRTLDQSPMASGALQVRQITLAPWTPDQMQAYCREVLGDDNALWPAIEGDAQQLDLCRLPFNLASQCELFIHLQRPARDRAELLSGLIWLRLRKEQGRDTLLAPGLLTVPDMQRLAGERWKQALLALPQQGCLLRWLDASAERMHRDGREVSVARSDLLLRLQAQREADLAGGAAGAEPAAWLHAVQALGLLAEGDIDPRTGEANLRFTHQLWQEFFAARGLRGMPTRARDSWPDLRPPALVPLEQVLGALGVQEALPGPGPSHWEEAVKMALQFEPDPEPWITALHALNLPLAGRAAAGVAARLGATSAGRDALASLRSALLQRSRDPAADLRGRIEAAGALGPLGDPRFDEGKGPDGHRYLLPRHWVMVPAGRYVIGADTDEWPDETPATAVDLTAFQLAFAPVTNAEFACFIAAGGYDDERWWVGETARTWRRSGLRNEAEIERVGKLFADLRRDVDATLRRVSNLTEANHEQFRDYATWSEDRCAATLEQWYGARRCSEPLEWQNPHFNQPLQPVVSLCLFEARAYVCWLAAQTARLLALPTEAQWEAAARGLQRRVWPWGDAPPARWQINADPAHLRQTSPVGVFPDADTSDGLADLSGNVWEWTDSRYTDRLDAVAVSRVANDDSARRAVRGGSWNSHSVVCRAGYRNGSTPDDRYKSLGFRVVCCPVPGP